ncbi:MAG: HAD-IB family hydrolase [Chryseosolibacter sp.]
MKDVTEVTDKSGTSIHPAINTAARTKKLVLFDFDGTITTRDTLIEFVKFYRGPRQYMAGLLKLAPILSLYALKIIPNWKAKQFFLTTFFKGERVEDFNERCVLFSTKVLPSLIRPGARQAIEAYRGEGATVAVVSASAENWVKPWCDAHGLLCLSTRLQVKDGTLTGEIEGRNCYGDEKVCRIKEHFKLTDFDEVIAYGDSRGDKEMLQLAHRAYFKPFRA